MRPLLRRDLLPIAATSKESVLTERQKQIWAERMPAVDPFRSETSPSDALDDQLLSSIRQPPVLKTSEANRRKFNQIDDSFLLMALR